VKKVVSLALILVFLTGCSSPNGDDAESDTQACQKLSELASLDSTTLDKLSPQSLAETLRTDVAALAGEGLQSKVEELASELEKESLEPTAIVAVGSEIALRCALVGVSFDFSNLGQLLN